MTAKPLPIALRAVALAATVALASHADACSLCIAHATGGGLFGIGAQKLKAHTALLGISHLGFAKTNAGEGEGEIERENFHQTSLEGLYGIDERLMARLSIPSIAKSIQMGDAAAESASGLGDVVTGLTYQLPPRPGQRFLTALLLDIKLPTGENDAADEGVRREEHLQLGTGSTDVTLGVSATGEAGVGGHLWFASLRQRVNGKNNHGYRYGDVTLYSAGYARAVGAQTQAVVEWNGRIARRDRTGEGGVDENSGGHLGYAALSVRHAFSGGMGAIATVQQPVLKNLHGVQDEKAVFTLSLTRSL